MTTITERKKIPGRVGLRQRLPWPFAGLFGLVGVFGAIKTLWMAEPESFRYATPLRYAVATVLAIGGVVLLRIAIRGLRDFQGRLQREEGSPDKPWLWSARPWDPENSLSLEPGVGVFKFDRFPYFFGNEITGTITLNGPLATSPRLLLTLRHLEEEPVKRLTGGTPSKMAIYSVYEHSVEVDGAREGSLPVRLPLPSWDPRFKIHFGPFNVYWVLDVETVPPGSERASFLLPIYPAPGTK